MSIDISFAIFSEISGSDAGGALNIASKTLKIKFCSFNNCGAKTQGGAVFTSYCPMTLANTMFHGCYVSTSANGKFGNAMNCENINKGRITDVSTCRCGKERSNSGDSSMRAYKGFCIICSLNSSSNYGIEGASIFSALKFYEGSIIKYSQGYDTHDMMFVEGLYTDLNIANMNLVNSSDSYCKYCLWSDLNNPLLTATSCYFYDITVANKFTYGRCKFVNCVSNIAFSSISFTIVNITQTYKIFGWKNFCTTKAKTNAHRFVFITILILSK